MILRLIGIVLLVISIVLCIAFIAIPAHSHTWYTGQKNESGNSCCGGEDCGPINPAAVHMVSPTHWQITVAPGQLGTYNAGNPEPVVLDFHGNPGISPDSQLHVCATVADIGKRKARCLFVGGSM